jgi:uncharacterized protein DUF6585
VIHSPPEAVYPRGLTYRLAALIFTLVLAVSLVRFRVFLGTGWFWGLLAAAVLGTAAFWKHEAGKSVQIHPEGVVLRSGASRRAMTWESVREIRYRALHSRGGGVLGVLLQAILRRLSKRSEPVDERGVSIRCVLLAEGNRPIVITSGWSRAGSAVEKILERVNPRLLKTALDRVRTEGRAEFGPVLIQHDSIARGSKSVRFAEIASCGLEGGRFFVKKQGAWLAVIQVPVGRIPNVFVLVELLRHLGVPGLRRGDLASATGGF